MIVCTEHSAVPEEKYPRQEAVVLKIGFILQGDEENAVQFNVIQLQVQFSAIQTGECKECCTWK